MPAPEQTTPVQEGTYHSYVGHAIPWFLRLLWIIFWCYAAWYVVTGVLPALDAELLTPP